MRFVYRGRLAGRNKEINANRSHWAAGAKVKADAQASIMWAIKAARLERVTEPVEVYIEWHEAPRRRDVDNIQSSTKYILDALVTAGVLPNDNLTWVRQVYQKVVKDDEDYVVVELDRDGYEITRRHHGNIDKQGRTDNGDNR